MATLMNGNRRRALPMLARSLPVCAQRYREGGTRTFDMFAMSVKVDRPIGHVNVSTIASG